MGKTFPKFTTKPTETTVGLKRREGESDGRKEGEQNDECEETNFMSLFFSEFMRMFVFLAESRRRWGSNRGR